MLIKLKGYHLNPDENGNLIPSEQSSGVAIPAYTVEAVETFPFLTVDIPDFIYNRFDGLPVVRYGGGYYFMAEIAFDKLITLIEAKTINYN